MRMFGRVTPPLAAPFRALRAGGSALLSLLPVAATAAGTGAIVIGEREWDVVASMQCSIFPDPVVAIAGHAAHDESTEITVDHDPGSNFIEAKVVGEDLRFSARNEALTVSIEGDTVRGEGEFEKGWRGPTMPGSFDIDC